MKSKLLCLAGTFLLALSVQVNAQAVKTDTISKQTAPSPIVKTDKRQLNFVKVNLFGIPLRNYSFQYERALSKRFSVAIAYRTMPSTGLPFKSLISDAVGDEGIEGEETIDNIRISGSAITPEIRLYLGKKGYGRGFYFAPFYRKATFETNNIPFTYEDSEDTGEENSINLSGKFSSNTGGLMMGAQWALGKYVCLDWWILGAHFGTGKGDFVGLSSKPLSQSDQAAVREELENLDIPFVEKTVNVNANSASLKLEGPWGGLRGGLSLGFKF
ncbi:hypothetical protein [Adhaeribacter rhizoryzae]|uniref:DUF3575 domain-containing protein n=1 Tax=Adhaeribacter rhizoryzae TaxID=2607907 RepID=A0A5M6DHG7_9BACT|nr:hypothetical protein [Adhaeribacter rhizoryzae]KAA5545629.1 DUF3575 domain-containing protein [Adhaeribacter rhizoryzae]